ncbi:MAG: hypothetical protein WBO45_06235, partial [Planctomycetota bacterium]
GPGGRAARRQPGAGASADDDAGRDDCQSANERTRLRELGPIQPAELKRCDLEDLLRKLSG